MYINFISISRWKLFLQFVSSKKLYTILNNYIPHIKNLLARQAGIILYCSQYF